MSEKEYIDTEDFCEYLNSRKYEKLGKSRQKIKTITETQIGKKWFIQEFPYIIKEIDHKHSGKSTISYSAEENEKRKKQYDKFIKIFEDYLTQIRS